MPRDRSTAGARPGHPKEGITVGPAPDHAGILIVSELFPPAIGGSASLLYEIYRRLPGQTVTVLTDAQVSPGPPCAEDGPFTVLRQPIATRQWGVASPTGTWHHVALGARIRALARRPGTVVHCARALPEGIAAWVSHTVWGPRYICWSHGEDVTMALGSREYTWVATRVYRGASAVVANSHNTRALLLTMGLAESRVHVVHPGVDPDRFRPGLDVGELRASLLRGGDTLLLSVGRLQRRKGHDLAIAAMAALKDSRPGLRYLIVGDGEDRGRLVEMVAEHGLGGMVSFAGQIGDADLPRYFAAADVFLMPNRKEGDDIEGFGIVFLEAASSGKPAIGGRSGGVAEAIDHNRTGLLVGGTDAAELAGAIGLLADDPGRRDAMGRAGRTRVLQGFTWDHSAAKLAAIHDAVAATA